MRKHVIPLVALSLALGWAAADADMGKVWTTTGTDQFAAGELDGVSVLSTGEIELAPEATQIEGIEAEYVWDIEVSDNGAAYVATGSPGAVYTLEAGRAKALYRNDKEQVLCVLPMPDGAVLAGTAPDGIIYRINRRGQVSTFADLEDNYVWDMAMDSFSRIFCATGPNGRLLELDRAGTVTERLKVKQKNLMCVAVTDDGTVYVGTDPDGHVYQMLYGGKASVLYDADESEVHDIVLDASGAVYACTAQSKAARPSGPPQSGAAPQPPSVQPRTGAPGAPNSVYRIVPGQGAEKIATLNNVLLLAVAAVDDQILVGTGPEGRIVSVDQQRHLVGVVSEFDAENVTALALDPDGDILVGTAKAGGLWRLGGEPRRSGTFVSKPFNAGYLSHWGRAWWRERRGTGQGVRVKLRTGNSSKPDEHWSDWSPWMTVASGQAVEAPMGRFAQFSAELSTRPATGSPVLLEVNVSYRQANRRPVIEDLLVDGASLLKEQQTGGRPQPRSAPPTASRSSRPGGGSPAEKQVVWKAADPNGDKLLFDLYYRGTDERTWKLIEKDLENGKPYKWDTSRVPDGYYILKLVARDDAVRPPQEALRHERESRPLLVDNRPPTVEQIRARRQADGSYELSGVARDGLSSITAIEVSRNSGDWRPVFPTDGILDSPEEPFSFVTQVLEPGEHVFAFSVTDKARNVGSGKIVVTVE